MKKILVLFIIGIFLILFSYLSYALIIPPFYELKSRDFAGSFSKSIDPGEKNAILIWPTNVTEVLKFDVSFSMNVSYIKSIPEPINVTVYVGYEPFYHNGNIKSIENLTLSETFDRYSGWTFGLETPLHHGPDIFIRIENVGTMRTSISGDYTGLGYYREGSFVNFILFFLGIMMALGSTLHSLTRFTQARLEKRIREKVK